MKLAHEIVGLYKEVYYARRHEEADKTADRVPVQRSLVVEREAREKLAADLAGQQAVWAAEQAELLRDMATVVQDRDADVRDKDAAEHEL